MTSPSRQSYRIISLTQGMVCKVDTADYDWLMQWKWSVHLTEQGYYARASDVRFPKSKRRIYMHRLLLGLESGDRRMCDHRNRDRLDNRKNNLRITDHAHNSANRIGYGASGFKGVRKAKKKWVAEITLNKKTLFLGTFPTPEEAHAAYCGAAKIIRGEFACTENRTNA